MRIVNMSLQKYRTYVRKLQRNPKRFVKSTKDVRDWFWAPWHFVTTLGFWKMFTICNFEKTVIYHLLSKYKGHAKSTRLCILYLIILIWCLHYTSWMNNMLDPGSQCYLLFTHDHARTRIEQTMREHMLKDIKHKSNGTIECKIVIGPPNYGYIH